MKMQQDNPAQDALPISPESEGVSLFREAAIKHHFGDSESIGMVYTSARWPWSVLLLSILIVVAASVFVCTTRLDAVELTDGVVYIDDPAYAASALSGPSITGQPTTGHPPTGYPLVIAYLPVEKSAALHLGDSVKVAARNALRGSSVFMSGQLVRIKELDASETMHDARAQSVQIEIALRVPPPDKSNVGQTNVTPTSVSMFNGMPVTVHVTVKQQRLIDSLLSSFQRQPR